MQAHAEHQQDDADLRQLGRKGGVGDEPGGVRTDSDARNQITDERRQLQPIGQHSEHEGQYEAPDQGGNQAVGMRHRRSRIGLVCLSMGERQILGPNRRGARPQNVLIARFSPANSYINDGPERPESVAGRMPFLSGLDGAGRGPRRPRLRTIE